MISYKKPRPLAHHAPDHDAHATPPRFSRAQRWGVYSTHSLLSRLCDVLIGFEEGTDVQRLAAPDVAVDGPVEGELERAAVEVAVCSIREVGRGQWVDERSLQDLGSGGHVVECGEAVGPEN